MPSDFEVTVEVWPENWRSLEVFLRVSDQWRVGSGGVIGLDHGALYKRLDRMNLPAEEYDALFDDVCVLAASAVETMNEKT